MKSFLSFLLFAPLVAGGVVPGRYIVELSTEPLADHVVRLHGRGESARLALRGAEAQTHRGRLRAEQREASARIVQEEGRILGQVETVKNAVLVEIDDARAARLATLPGVRKVYPVRELRMLMDRATVLHHAPEAWSRVGLENAGAGVKIAIIDSGMDIDHPALQDLSLKPPAGFPKSSYDSDLAYTNSKVIVARSYTNYLQRTDPDRTPRDHVGHGTALGLCSAGVSNTAPLATLIGMAPKAWLGNYKVFGTPGVNDNTNDAAVLKAIDDAVADGMDVINLSLGSTIAPYFEDDPEIEAVERAATLGVLVIVSAGNSGPDLGTVGSPAIAPSAIAVGASGSDRTFSTSVKVGERAPVVAVPGNGIYLTTTITAPIVDVERLDGTGLACGSLRAGSLSGSIAFILRGQCTFEAKLLNAQAAGAVGAIVYTHSADPSPSIMVVGASTLPAEMIGYEDGVAIKAALGESVSATLQFTLGATYLDPARLASFSSKGPNIDYSVKPDLVATGTNIYTATQKLDPRGDMYNTSGYTLEGGTSFASPIVAGAAALLKAARPGLSVAEYRSLLVNSAAPAYFLPGTPATVQQAGAGVLDAAAALDLKVAAAPTSLSFGLNSATPISRTLNIENLGTSTETFTVSVAPSGGGPAPSVTPSSVQLEPGRSTNLTVVIDGGGAAPGAYEGYIAIQPASGGAPARVPYWLGAPSGAPAQITILDGLDDGRAGFIQTVYFKITDRAGIPVNDLTPEVTTDTIGASVESVRFRERLAPNLWALSARLSPLRITNVFRIKVGDAVKEISIDGN
jgi:subtilisin family serine protease